MTYKIIIIVSASILLGPLASGQASRTDSALKAASKLYDSGSYESAELAARRLLEQAPILDSVRIEAERIIAFSLVAQGKMDLAREHFESILALNPTFALDPILTSPKILTVFQEARLLIASRYKGEGVSGGREDNAITSVSFRTAFFPGWEQYHQGRSEAGLIFASAGVLTLGSAITFEFLRAPARTDYLSATHPAEIASKYNTYNRYYRGEAYSFIAFAAIYVASEFDVFLNVGRSVEIKPSVVAPNSSGVSLLIDF